MSSQSENTDKQRFDAIKKAGIVGVVGNILLFIIKATSGILFRSSAMIADAANSAGDIFSSALTTIGNRISSTPSDEDHNLGHGKAEYIFSLFISIGMILVAGELLVKDITNLVMKNNTIVFSKILVAASIITIAVKMGMFIYTYAKAKRFKSILLNANMKDHRNDCVITAFTLISIICSKFGYGMIDSIVGIGISIWIAYTGLKIFKESYDVLMDISIDEDTKNKILEIIKKYPEIQKINHLNSSPVGAKYMISVSIFVDGNMSTYKSHEIANNLEKEISSLHNVHLTIIHVNPIWE